MKKTVANLFVLLFICNCSHGQLKKTSIGLGPTIGFPVANSNFSYYYKKGIGVSLQVNFGITKLGAVTTDFSFLSMGVKNPPAKTLSLTTIKTGYRTHFLNSGFFVGAEAGAGLYSVKNATTRWHFIASAGAGYTFHISGKSYIDVFPSYLLIVGTTSNTQWLNANILYRVKLVKKK